VTFQLILSADISSKIMEDRRINGLLGSAISRHWHSFAKVYPLSKFLLLSDTVNKRILHGSLKGALGFVRRLSQRGLPDSRVKRISFAVN
jgi:hypothetical protein